MVDTDTQKDQGGNPLGEGTIMGNDGERPYFKRDNFMHSKVANLSGNLVESKSMERHLNMEPYPALYSDESFATHSAQVLKEAAAAPEAAELALDGAGAIGVPGAASLGQDIGRGIGGLMHNVLGIGGGSSGGGGSSAPAPTPGPASVPAISSVLADYESPGSYPSVGLREGDPTRTDQHEFNDGDNTNRPDNPNLEDSGASGEDQVRQNAGFAPDSPALERARILAPLLRHYYNSPESGAHEPLLMGLHQTLHDENPNYLDGADSPESQAAAEAWINQHRGLGVHAKTAIAQPNMFGPQQSGTGQCKSCGSPTTANGSCPTCGAQTDPSGAIQGAGGAANFNPGMGMTAANHQGPITPQQVAAVQQLLIQQGRIGELPNVPLNPQDYAKEMAEIQGNPNLAPQVDPSQVQPPPQPPMGPPGAGGPPPGMDPSQDPSQGGGGGMPPQMGKVAGPLTRSPERATISPGKTFPFTAADNIARRCPKCGSGTTGLMDGDSGTCYCHSCGNQWENEDIKGQKVEDKLAARVSEDLQPVNPSTQPAAEHGHRDIMNEQDSSLTWQDGDGQPLQAGKEYEMHNPAYEIPDIVKVVFIHPNEVGLKLVGQFSNETGDNAPDIKLTQQRAKEDNITFVPSQAEQQDIVPPQTTPGQSQVGPASQTTDEVQNSYPTQSSIRRSNGEDDDEPKDTDPGKNCADCGKDLKPSEYGLCANCDEKAFGHNSKKESSTGQYEFDADTCPQCSSSDIEHRYASETREMHTCFRCEKVWETPIEDYGHESSIDLSWLNEGPDDDFHENFERAAAMRASGAAGSRNIGDIAARDPRLAEISERLRQNKQDAEEFLRTAGRKHSPSEQRSLIDEKGFARNSDLLDLENTHYKIRSDFSGKPGNGENVPESHLLLGV
jgi:hypothetical protein